MRTQTLLAVGLLACLAGCKQLVSRPLPRNFGTDVQFLEHYTEVVLLGRAGDAALVVVAPDWQGRVMTSTAGGSEGKSYGWINYELIRSGEPQDHIHARGGEDRFWLGPEAGPYALFFPPEVPFEYAHWQTPAPIDSEPWSVIRRSERQVTLLHEATLTNRAGATFDVTLQRTVRLLDSGDVLSLLGVHPAERVRMVAYETENAVRNRSARTWTAEDGLLSIWILGMFRASPYATAILPYVPGPEAERGPLVNDAYFGEVPPERLTVTPGALLFRGDAQYRSKIGLSPRRARAALGSYDAGRGLLTVIAYDLVEGEARYVNSMWGEQEDPYAGDAVNAYNDGPSEGGAGLGAFYELETSSPALALGPGQLGSHRQRTFHFEGAEADLDPIARRVLGVSLHQLPHPPR